MRLSRVLLCLAAGIMCCGCMPNTQLEERAIVQAAGVDLVDGIYRLTMQIFDPTATAENAGGSEAYLLLEGSGTTLTAAALQAAQKGKEIYLGSCQVLIIGKEAMENSRDILDYFNSQPQTRATMMITCAPNAAGILQVAKGKSCPPPSVICEQELRLAENEKRLLPCRLVDIFAAVETPGRDAIIPFLGVEGTGSTARPSIRGAVVLQGDSPALMLTPQELQVIGWTSKESGGLILELEPEQNTSVCALLEEFDPKLSVRMQENVPCLSVDLKAKGRVSQWEGAAAEQLRPEQLQAAQQAAADQMAQQLALLLQKLCSEGCDPLRFGERLQRRNTKDWNSYSKDWSSLLQKARWSITVSCTLSSYSGR